MLLRLGLSCLIDIMGGFTHHHAISVAFMSGLLAIPLALWLLTESVIAFRIAFAVLVFVALVYFSAPIVAWIVGAPPPMRRISSFLVAGYYTLPIILVVLSRRRSGAPEGLTNR
jgi:hypothetical protein